MYYHVWWRGAGGAEWSGYVKMTEGEADKLRDKFQSAPDRDIPLYEWGVYELRPEEGYISHRELTQMVSQDIGL